MPTSLSTPVVVLRAQVLAETALLPAPEVVRDPDRRHREDARLCEREHPARERQPQPARWFRSWGPNASRMSRSCRPRWRKPDRSWPVARCSSRPRPRRRPGRRDRLRGYRRPQPGRRRAGRRPRERSASACAAPRAAPRVVAGGEADQSARACFAIPETAALLAGEHGDRDVGVAVEERPQVAAEIGVAEQEVACRRRPLAGQRLPLAAVRQADDARARGLGDGGRRVTRAVVGDDDLRRRKVPLQPPPPSSRSALSLRAAIRTAAVQPPRPGALDRRQPPRCHARRSRRPRPGRRGRAAPPARRRGCRRRRRSRAGGAEHRIRLCFSTRVGSTPTTGTLSALPSPW